MAILTCKNHTNLRWSCKDIAITNGGYNGMRNIFFQGIPSGRGMYADGSGLYCTEFDGNMLVRECSCSADLLELAPEDALVKR